MKTLTLTRGLVAIVDDDDFEALSAWKWSASARGYAYRMQVIDGRQKYIAMHRQIMGLGPGDPFDVDHRDGIGTNNWRDNLRVCAHVENAQNRRMSRRNSSGFKGVSLYKKTGRWCAQIMVSGKQNWLGQFDTPELAHAAYCAAADRLHGEFANHG